MATIEHYGGSICDDKELIENELRKEGGKMLQDYCKEIMKARVLGCAAIKRANMERYK